MRGSRGTHRARSGPPRAPQLLTLAQSPAAVQLHLESWQEPLHWYLYPHCLSASQQAVAGGEEGEGGG